MNKEKFQREMSDILQKIKDIDQKEDTQLFNIEKKKILDDLKSEINQYSSDTYKKEGILKSEYSNIITKFWSAGNIVTADENILLRKIDISDKDDFLRLEIENSVMPNMYNHNDFCESMWESHIDDSVLNCVIAVDGKYVGYCGIENLSKKRVEISIEILKDYTSRGIGYIALKAFFDAIKDRLGISEFMIRIEPKNIASRKLFEKLGAIPNGISKFLLYDETDRMQFEKENLHHIDEDMKNLAKKFNVEPRKLLSHVLEYILVWE